MASAFSSIGCTLTPGTRGEIAFSLDVTSFLSENEEDWRDVVSSMSTTGEEQDGCEERSHESGIWIRVGIVGVRSGIALFMGTCGCL
jgi:hypothetical protein